MKRQVLRRMNGLLMRSEWPIYLLNFGLVWTAYRRISTDSGHWNIGHQAASVLVSRVFQATRSWHWSNRKSPSRLDRRARLMMLLYPMYWRHWDVPTEEASTGVRVGLGRFTTEADIDLALTAFERICSYHQTGRSL